ncbi:MAG: DUF86 domain-containing protein [Victivallaceae bacterium]|jgi:uncharacterized protein YutE (UPF0331/DUF86 family)|nr:DUF86 domain-containing protein [Victivallaceae bacterium]
MKYNGIIQKKTALLADYLTRLRSELNDVTFARFNSNWAMQRMTERSLQVMIEIIIDIAERVIAIENAGPAETAGRAIEKLVELKVITKPDPYVDMVRFRNLIVHRYEAIEPELLYTIATAKLSDFDSFMQELDKCD